MIDIEVHGDAGQIRDVGRWLRTMSRTADAAGSEFRAARGRSESAWDGRAGERFRSSAGQADGRVATVRSGIDAAERVLDGFARALDEVRTQIGHACDVARAGGLTVTATAILDPGPAPAAPGPIDGWAGHAEQVAHQAAEHAVQAHDAMVHAYQQAGRIVAAARTKEHGAHTTVSDVLEELDVGPDQAVQSLFDLANGFAENRFATAAKAYGKASEDIRRLGFPRAADELADAASDASKLENGVKWGGRALAGAGAAYGAYDDIKDGEDVDQAIVSNGASGLGGYIAGGATAGAIGGPWGVVGGVVVGAGVGIGMKYGIDKVYDRARDWTVGAAGDAKDWTVGAAGDAKDWTVGAAGDAKDWTTGAAGDAKDWTTGAAGDVKKGFDKVTPW